MKKFLLFFVFTLFSVCANAYAIDARLKDININSKDSIINVDKSFKPIYRYLELKNYQYDEFYRIHNDVCQSIIYLEDNKSNGVKYFNNHLKYDLMNSSYILDKKQYHKYLMAVNVTLQNKNLMDYLIESED